MDALRLWPQWQTLFDEHDVSAQQMREHFDDLVRAYSEPHRVYHTLNHVQELLGHLRDKDADSQSSCWAAWYHDSVYRPSRHDNERRSADKASVAMCELGLPSVLITEVRELILATRTHTIPECAPENIKRFLDADMAILAAPRDSYLVYMDAVRREFCRIPDLFFTRGRKKFLRSLLQQERIYASDIFNMCCETHARNNIAFELARLGA